MSGNEKWFILVLILACDIGNKTQTVLYKMLIRFYPTKILFRRSSTLTLSEILDISPTWPTWSKAMTWYFEAKCAAVSLTEASPLWAPIPWNKKTTPTGLGVMRSGEEIDILLGFFPFTHKHCFSTSIHPKKNTFAMQNCRVTHLLLVCGCFNTYTGTFWSCCLCSIWIQV